jgi:hypothetical protein
MCKFFSLISDGNGKEYYFNWEQRQAILRKEPEFNMVESADSHSSISSYYGFTGEKADKVNKYEYNPLTKEFTVDQINTTNDSCIIKKFCRNVDFKTIVKPLIIKKMFNPLIDVKAKKVTKKDIELLMEWASVWNRVRDSVWDSVWASVRDSVGDSVGDSVWASVRDSVGDSVWASVRDSVVDSVRASVVDSVWASVWDSGWDSVSTYFDIPYKHRAGISHKLWERGFVPSFDEEKWRLHAGKDAKIVWEGSFKK